MSLLSFVPLYVPSTISPGLDRLPPASQVRASWIPAALMLAGVPVLLVTTLALHSRYPWAPVYSLVVLAVLVVLAALRQLATASETRRLYGEVERAAETRRELLAQLMQRATRPPPGGGPAPRAGGVGLRHLRVVRADQHAGAHGGGAPMAARR